MKKLNRTTANILNTNREKVLQFGGGNFLRGFVDWMFDVYNEKTKDDLGILVVKSTPGSGYPDWQDQEGLYHVLTRGFQNGQIINEKYLVKNISRILHLYTQWEEFLQSAENPDMRFVVSNTTEAGIRFSGDDKMTDSPPNEFPAKLTLWLYHRYQYFHAQADKGCIFLPVELISDNGKTLRECILQNAENWGLEEEFNTWIKESNIFCNSLVDRIIPGISAESFKEEWEQLGFQDAMLTQGEAFHIWVIEAPEIVQKELPIDEIELNIVFTDDLRPYRTRKVRILNGAHTSMVPVGYLYGVETVRETMEHEVLGEFVKHIIFNEIVPTLDLPEEELRQFANDVIDRFKNPFFRHELISISLNSISKFKTRVLPSMLEYQARKGELPTFLVFSMAALITFYKGNYKGKDITLKDDPNAITFLQNEWKNCNGSEGAFQTLAENILTWEYAWNRDLSAIPGLKDLLSNYLLRIEKEGIKEALKSVVR